MLVFVIYLCCFQQVITISSKDSSSPVHGRYSRNIQKYELTVPNKVNKDGAFISYMLHSTFENSREKRGVSHEGIYYKIDLAGTPVILDLLPNRQILSPNSLVETRDGRNVNGLMNVSFTRPKSKQCHFRGVVREAKGSRVAVSSCDGLSGYIKLKDEIYFLEPLENQQSEGTHWHIVYKRSDTIPPHSTVCGTDDDWKTPWIDRFKRKFLESPAKGLEIERTKKESTEPKKRSDSLHRYLELLVVADKKFIKHHEAMGNDVETYILTVVNIMSDYFHDASIGNQVDVVVVRIVYLKKEEKELDLEISPNADKTLASFCKWQIHLNPTQRDHPNHHDIALLLTRHDICTDVGCGLAGLAYLASACIFDKACAISEDMGLLLGVIITHEVGHILGSAHDEPQVSGCQSFDKDGSAYVLNPSVNLNTASWSSCSRQYISTFFDSGFGDCLLNEPQEAKYTMEHVPAGVMYNADWQCADLFPNTISCGIQVGGCEKLFCKNRDGNRCISNSDPPFDGTSCGVNKWCFRKQCVNMGQRPASINGDWSNWSDWSRCSRTCGGGIMTSERDCTNPAPEGKGRYCLGERRRYLMCNVEPCDEKAPSFRQTQCSKYNGKPFKNKVYNQWVPFLLQKAAEEPCALYCSNEKRIFAKMSATAADGTPCKAGTRNVCITGQCRDVGCDWVIDSHAVEDQCGVCRGDGTQCREHQSEFQGHGRGYTKITTIPRGCRNVEVLERDTSPNIISIAEENRYTLNGNNVEENDGERLIGGSVAFYSHPEPDRESLIIHGPLKNDVDLYYVFYKNHNPGVYIKYFEPVPDDLMMPRYVWEYLQWKKCSHQCGGGISTAEPSCVEDTLGRVSDSYCADIEKPVTLTRTCNNHPCRKMWKIGAWTKCSCHKRKQWAARRVECVQENPKAGAESIILDEAKCPKPIPASKKLCRSVRPCRNEKYQNKPPEKYKRSKNIDCETFSIVRELNEILTILSGKEQKENDDSTHENLDLIRNNEHMKINKRVVDNKQCSSPNNDISKAEDLVKDHVHTNENIEEEPIIHKEDFPLSDEAFEEIGDKVGVELDDTKRTVYKGKKAEDILKHGLCS